MRKEQTFWAGYIAVFIFVTNAAHDADFWSCGWWRSWCWCFVVMLSQALSFCWYRYCSRELVLILSFEAATVEETSVEEKNGLRKSKWPAPRGVKPK